jgi:hypothetical protein
MTPDKPIQQTITAERDRIDAHVDTLLGSWRLNNLEYRTSQDVVSALNWLKDQIYEREETPD